MMMRAHQRAALVIAGVIFLVGASSGVSWALWSVTASTSATVAAGTVSLTANNSASVTLTALSTSALGPGTALTSSVSVKNVGTLPLSYDTTFVRTMTPTTAVIGANIDYAVWVTGSTSNCTNAATIGTPSWTGTFAAASGTLGTGRSLAVGATEILCVRTTMKTAAPQAAQGQSVAPTFTFTGSNGGWTGPASAQYSQASAVVPPVTYTSCSTNSARTEVTLTWAAAPATVNGSALKDYYIEWVYDTGAPVTTAVVATTTYVGSQSGMSGTSTMKVYARYNNGWNTLTPSSYAFNTRTGQAKASCNPDF